MFACLKMSLRQSSVVLAVTVLMCSFATNGYSQTSVDFTEQEINAILSHGPWPTVVPPDPGNELSGLPWAEKLGESLFFDNALSVSSTVSCGSCHQPDRGFSDNLPTGIGVATGKRNTQGLFDVGLQRWFGWDGGADSLWAATIRPMLNPHEMGNSIDKLAQTLRSNEHFTSIVSQNRSDISRTGESLLNQSDKTGSADHEQWLDSLSDTELLVIASKSIAAFMRTIQSNQTAFDQFRNALAANDFAGQNAYSNSAKRGLKIFLGEANCRVCHFGANFSNGEFHDTGRPFFTGVGEVDSGRYSGLQRVKNDQFNLLGKYSHMSSNSEQLKTAEVKQGQLNWGQWRTPSLRNLELTGPYMHDGSLESLRDVVDSYADINPDRLHTEGESILKPLELNEDQRNDLVNFLLSLSAN